MHINLFIYLFIVFSYTTHDKQFRKEISVQSGKKL